MTKTKEQLRAEAVERLKDYEGWRRRVETDEFDPDLLMAVIGVESWDATWQGNRDSLIDLLTDDKAQDGTTPEFDVPMYGWHEGGGRMSCEYCDGISNPIVACGEYKNLLFCIRDETLLMLRPVDGNWWLPSWSLNVNYCPMCGRRLK